jgi:TRAP-type C4-dicarboxylate transport system permease small subunit
MLILLRKIAWLFAWLGGLIALAVAVMTVVSVVQRALTTKPIQGDIEMVQMGIAISISLCLAWCQLRGANIIVDFFTQRILPARSRMLDGIGCVLIAVMYGLLAWRTSIGAFAVRAAGETTMTIELPMWWAYASLAPGLALAALIALVQAGNHFRNGDASALTGDTQ